ncbi:MAG TPA: LysE family transporter [Methylibium sp.]|uniref:LysE family transporter n=1 Tax=Methylibium sp. TaxID=2067992 RepID=UPI002DBABB68|nr:LysE family transporter [Methylibium sp.]HEU4458008.1 LysE family transporter [Methylibium sp.]
MEPSTWLAFFAASWAISISPGAGAVAAMSAGARHGFVRGYPLTIGLVLGIWTQVLAVAIGVGALIATSALAFAVVKWVGVAYLLWLGISHWRAPARPLVADAASAELARPLAMVLRGWAVNAVNPKGTVFLLAVVPQFLDLARPLGTQYLWIAATLGFTDLVVMAVYTALGAQLLRALKEPGQIRWINRCFGGLFVGVAALLATVRRGG